MPQSLKNRIASINTLVVAVLMAIAFMVIYVVVNYTAYRHLDDDLVMEKNDVFKSLDWNKKGVSITKKMSERDEEEHSQIQANPTFLQITDTKGQIVFKSSNLQSEELLWKHNSKKHIFFNGEIHGQRLRLGQFRLMKNDREIIGYLTIGVSRQESYVVLISLFYILLISYIFLLLSFFAVMWLAASKAIKPIKTLMAAASGIGGNNIQERLPLPINKDEIWQLAKTINELLERLDRNIQQLKQFSADVSHEMRTPLTAIKGTLEVLLLRERTTAHYEDKLNDVLTQTNRLAQLYDEMLELAKVDSGDFPIKSNHINLSTFIRQIVDSYQQLLQGKDFKLSVEIPENITIVSDEVLLERIINNLLSNAIKYNKAEGNIYISWKDNEKKLSIKDEGIGISKEHLAYIFNRFYRADISRSSVIKGNGIGLFIVKKLCDVLNIPIEVSSDVDKGSEFMLNFSNNL